MSKPGHLYLIQLREFIKTNESIYKIGKSIDINTRFKSYPKNSKLILLMECNNITLYENKIIKQFSSIFINRKDIGREYFEGDIKLIKKEFINILNEEIIEDGKEINEDNNYSNVDFNNDDSTLCRIWDQPIDVTFHDDYVDKRLTIFDQSQELPDFYSMPVIEKILKSADKFVAQIQTIIISYFDITIDLKYSIDYDIFINIYNTLFDNTIYENDLKIIDCVLIKICNYKRYINNNNSIKLFGDI